MQDAVRPTDETFVRFYERGYRTWFQLREGAISLRGRMPDLDFETVIPRHPYFPPQLELDRSSSSVLYATGTSTWETTRGACDLPPFNRNYVFTVTTVRATPIFLSPKPSSGFPEWFGNEGNHVSVLTLAWAYALAARWTEIIPGASPIQYTDSQALWDDGDDGVASHNSNDDSTFVDVGDLTGDAARWWAAVLAPEEGWNAVIPHNDRLLKSPWSVRLLSDKPLVLSRGTCLVLPVSRTGTSFSAAVRYILDYTNYHGVPDQSRAAFAAALLLPTSRRAMKQISLPPPRTTPAPRLRPQSPSTPDCPPWGADDRQLDRLLTLSCNSTGIISLLSSVFVDTAIQCNVSGAWMQAAFAILDSEPAKDPHVLARILMSRAPKIGFLWLGAVLIDMQTYIMRWARPVAFLMDLHAAAWTDTVVSFVQDPVPKLAEGAETMLRSNDARLMFLSQAEYHTQPPTVPFGPFGTIDIKDCILEVQLHAHCPARHALRYAGWAWNCTNGTRTAQDPVDVPAMPPLAATDGPDSTSRISIQYDGLNRDRDCSESMTRNMFLWLRGTDGFPVAEREICQHEWIDGWDSDEESVAPEGDGKSTARGHVGPWMSRVVTHRCNTL